MPPELPFVGQVTVPAAPIVNAASLPLTFQLAPMYLCINVKPPTGNAFHACLDTGSSVSLIDRATLERFPHTLTTSNLVIHTASTPTRAMGCAAFPLHVPCHEQTVARVKIQCYIIDNLPPQLILGMDFILHHGILYDVLKGVITLQSCGLRTSALSCMATTGPQTAPIVAQVSVPPSLDVLVPDMRTPLDMDGYQLPFTIIPDHPHSEAMPIFDDGILRAFQECFLSIFSKFPEAIDLVFDELTWQGHLTTAPPGTPCSWPVFVVYHEGKPCPVVDLRQLNDVVDPDVYPLPTPDKLREKLAGAKYITMFDLCKAFYQMLLHPDDHWKATVLTHCGQETLSCTIMGQSHSVSFLQQVLTEAFKVDRLSTMAFVYVDDFGVHSNSLDEHMDHIHTVLGVIQTLGLTLAQDKAHVACKEVPLLGHLVSRQGTRTMPSKCEAIKSIPYPAMLNQLEHMVGFFSYYKNYVPHFSALIAPLQHLKTTLLRLSPKTRQACKCYCTGMSVPDDTSTRQSLTKLKTILQDWALQFPDYSQPFLLYVDTSQQHGFALALHQNHQDSGIGDSIQCIDAIHLNSTDASAKAPVWFDSHALKPAEKSYWPTELEAAAAVWALFRMKRFLDALPGPHLLFTDHLAVTSIADAKPFSSTPAARNPRLVRFTLILAEFCPKLWILHRKGIYMAHVDALSRIQASETELASFHAHELIIDPGLIAHILQSQQSDSMLQLLHQELTATGKGTLPFDNGSFGLNADNILCRITPSGVWKPCIGTAALPRIIGLVHTGHLGTKATFDRFRAVAYAPHLLCHVEDFVKCCTQCQQMRTLHHWPYGSLQPLPAPDTPFTTISCDFIVCLPLACTLFDLDPVDTVLILTDTATCRIYLLSSTTTWSTERWSLRYVEQLLPHVGWPKKIISDRDLQLTSQFWCSLNTCYSCELIFSTAHHKSNGQSKRAIQSVELLLRGLCNAWSDDWADHLPLVELLLGNRPNASMNAAPNDLLYGLRLHDPFTMLQLVMSLSDLTLLDCCLALCQQALDHLALVQAYMHQWYNSLHTPPPKLAISDWVWLELHDGYLLPPSFLPPDQRLGIQHIGPYPIKHMVSNLAYEISLPLESHLHPVISIQHLEPYMPSDKPITTSLVTEILKEHKTHCCSKQYLVCFEHASCDKWVLENTVTNPAILEQWHLRRPLLPPSASPD